jgi:hypothetical protein
MRKIWITLLLTLPCLFAYGGDVSGGIVTNFLGEFGHVEAVKPNNPVNSSFVNETLGTATGDLEGALGVYVLSQTESNGTIFLHNHHHWVTEAGDTIFLADADAIVYPSGAPGLFAAIYPNGVGIIGGTGRFAGASGKIAAWGAANLNTNQLVLRYQGTISFNRQNQQ